MTRQNFPKSVSVAALKDGSGLLAYDDKEAATKCAKENNGAAIIHIQQEVEEGEGL